ncbi:MAG: type II toxin-antitoxin system Phd/YefM family antitoxin [Nocardioides sp.]
MRRGEQRRPGALSLRCVGSPRSRRPPATPEARHHGWAPEPGGQGPSFRAGGSCRGEHERITVTVHGRPTAVLLAAEDLEALKETITILSDPALLRSLGEADAELARG